MNLGRHEHSVVEAMRGCVSSGNRPAASSRTRSVLNVVRHGLITCTLFASGCSIRSAFVSEELSSPLVVPANLNEITYSIFLIGDAGEKYKASRDPVLAALAHHASESPERSLILFLGDNIYPNGMPDVSSKDRLEAERRLDEQVRVVEESGASGIFIPGNHDWRNGNADGWETLRREEEFLKSRKNPGVKMIPSSGCPGPEVLDIGDRIRLVILDTQWWLHDAPKPLHPTSDCGADSKEEVLDSLSRALRGAGDRVVVVAAHHPLDSYGRHAGFFDWKDHLFPLRELKSWMWIPLPVIGSLYPLARNLGITNQDFSSSAYRDMRARIEQVLAVHPPLAYVSGHDHVLQLLQGSRPYLIVVSGSGSSARSSTLTAGPNTLFAHLHPGFVRLDFLRDGRVRLGVIDAHGQSREAFSIWLVTKSVSLQ